MAKTTRLGKGAVKKIHAAVDDIFDRAKVRLLGPDAVKGKAIYIGFHREHSLPGLFEAAAHEERVLPDLDVLESLLRVAGNYIDGVRERAKARIVNELDALLIEGRAKGGIDPEEFQNQVKVKLSDIWGDVTNHIHMIVDTEAAKVKNVSTLEGIVRANAAAGIDDPLVYFVVVRDNILCEECKRLHLMDDGKTPRVWKMSELGHGYHKKGEDTPKIGGLHPHCRCTIVTLMPGYGFDKKGMVTYKKPGHNELGRQRDLGKSEPLMKTLSKAEFDESKHPRDPETGEFVATDPRWEDKPDREEPEVKVDPLVETEHLVNLIRHQANRGHKFSTQEIIEMFEDSGVWPKEPEKQEAILFRLGAVQKAEPGYIPSLEADLLWDQLRNEKPGRARVIPIEHLNDLVGSHKLYNHFPKAIALRYLIHRMEHLYDYDTPEKMKAMDDRFMQDLAYTNDLAHVDPQGRMNHPTLDALKRTLMAKPFLVDQLREHKKKLDAALKPFVVFPKGSVEPHVVLTRGLGAGARVPDRMLSCYQDTKENDVGGRVKTFHDTMVPLKNVWFSYDLADRKAGFPNARRHPEDEYLVSPFGHTNTPEEGMALTKLIPRGRWIEGQWRTGAKQGDELENEAKEKARLDARAAQKQAQNRAMKIGERARLRQQKAAVTAVAYRPKQ